MQICTKTLTRAIVLSEYDYDLEVQGHDLNEAHEHLTIGLLLHVTQMARSMILTLLDQGGRQENGISYVFL